MQPKQPTTSVNMALALLKYAAMLGFASAEIFNEASISPTLLEDPEARISFKHFNALWQVIARRAGDAHFGLHLVEAMHGFPSGEIMLAVVMNCSSAEQALEKLTRYHTLAIDFIQFRLIRGDRQAIFSVDLDGLELPVDRQLVEAELGLLTLMLRGLTEDRMKFVEVRFSHTQPADVSEHRRLFQCRLAFDQPGNALVIQNADLALPILGANPALLEMLEGLAQKRLRKLYEGDSWADQTAHSISELLLHGSKPALAAVARELALSPRALQDRLKAEGCTYQSLLDGVRKEAALDYMKQPNMSMFDVAFLLGFSDQSAFDHAFKRWTGKSPREYRG